MSDHRPKRRAEKSRARKFARRALIGGLGISMILALGVIVLYKRLEGNINQLDVNSQLGNRPQSVDGGADGLNVLVMGSDTRKGEGNAVAGTTPGLSDTTILLHLSADRSEAYGVSIPRDAMVERPACVDQKTQKTEPAGLTQFNSAYAIGGPACTIKTVESITGVFVDHFVVIDFNGFRQMVDALGGVQVCVPEEVNDTIGNIHLAAGTYNVTGEQALDYVRVRHGISSNGDIGRMKRQQTFVAAMIAKAISAGTLANPVRLVKFLDAATKSLTTDPEFANLKRLASLGSSLQNIGLDKVTFLTAPWQEYPPDPNRVELSPQAEVLWQEMADDKPLSSEFSGEAVKASDGTPGAARQRVQISAKGVEMGAFLGDSNAEQLAAEAQASRDETASSNGLCA